MTVTASSSSWSSFVDFATFLTVSSSSYEIFLTVSTSSYLGVAVVVIASSYFILPCLGLFSSYENAVAERWDLMACSSSCMQSEDLRLLSPLCLVTWCVIILLSLITFDVKGASSSYYEISLFNGSFFIVTYGFNIRFLKTSPARSSGRTEFVSGY